MRRLFLALPALVMAVFLGQAGVTHASGYNVNTTSCRYTDSYGDVTTVDITYDYTGTSVYRDANSADASFSPGIGRDLVAGYTTYSGNGSYLTANVTGQYANPDQNATDRVNVAITVNMYPSGAYACS